MGSDDALLLEVAKALAGSKVKAARRASARGIQQRNAQSTKKLQTMGAACGDSLRDSKSLPKNAQRAAGTEPQAEIALAAPTSGVKRAKKRKCKKRTVKASSEPKANHCTSKRARKASGNYGQLANKVENLAEPSTAKVGLSKDPPLKQRRNRKLRDGADTVATDVSGIVTGSDVFQGCSTTCTASVNCLFDGVVDVSTSSADSSIMGAAAFRKANLIDVSCSCPAPFQRFVDAEPCLGGALTQVLHALGYAKPTPIQAQAWPIALMGLDMVGIAQTGSGKTCAFLLPALVRIAANGPCSPPQKIDGYHSEPARPSVLIVAPTRELVQQISGEAEKFAPSVRARVVCLYGGVPKGDQVRELKQGADILIACPGRLLDLEAGDMSRDIWSTVTLNRVSYLVLDEADRMLDMGFEPAIREIVGKCPGGIGKRQTLFFTATWPTAVQHIATSITKTGTVHVRIGQIGGADQFTATRSVNQSVVVLREDQKTARLRKILINDLKPSETAIVFAARKPTCDSIEADILSHHNGQPILGDGGWCGVIHGDKEQWEREQNLAIFRDRSNGLKGAGKKSVLVATDVASRGLDIPGVALVVIYDFGGEANRPGVDSYVHRIGRTGRAGKTGRSVTFFSPDDNGAAAFVEVLKGAKQNVPQDLQALVAKDKVRLKERMKKRKSKANWWSADSARRSKRSNYDASWW